MTDFKAVKVIAYEALTPCGLTAATSWLDIMAGKSAITYLAGSLYPQAHVPLETAANERAFILASRAIQSVLDQAPAGNPAKIALVLSTAKGEIGLLEQNGALPQDLTAKIQTAFGFAPTTYTISNACASGLIAIAQGMRLIQDGDFDYVLVCGVDLCTDFTVSGFGSLHALSEQFTTPYDKNRNGLNLGEGSGALLLAKNEAPEKAVGWLEGFGISNDANHITGPSRTGDGLAAAMREALNRAAIPAEEVDLLNGHGTGTKYNDAMELLAIKTVFPEKCPPLFSYKGYLGHTIGAAGIIEAALTFVGLDRQQYPASHGFTAGELPPLVTIAQAPDYQAKLNHVLAFKAGFGGINAALLMGRGTK